jgi:hypothetical protein
MREVDEAPMSCTTHSEMPAATIADAPVWAWGFVFVHSGLRRLVEIGALSPADAVRLRDDIEGSARQPGVRTVTPGVAEIIARKT